MRLVVIAFSPLLIVAMKQKGLTGVQAGLPGTPAAAHALAHGSEDDAVTRSPMEGWLPEGIVFITGSGSIKKTRSKTLTQAGRENT
ncbi:hypothetical protein VLK31_27415 [Variovorax sp. H27-G14]|uniref:hypothetical protein n=1 Tax=Variovorax sp. H27-G14 TaxID=3111914 RepID=UPI0038FC9C0F